MPRYRYRCPDCGDFEFEQSIYDALPRTHDCGAEVRPVIGTAAIFFPYGRDQFHDTTIAAEREDILRKCKEDGIQAEPVGHRDYSGPVSA